VVGGDTLGDCGGGRHLRLRLLEETNGWGVGILTGLPSITRGNLCGISFLIAARAPSIPWRSAEPFG